MCYHPVDKITKTLKKRKEKCNLSKTGFRLRTVFLCLDCLQEFTQTDLQKLMDKGKN